MPLIKNRARKLTAGYGLPASARLDMQQAGIEGMLVAIDSYKGGTLFNPTMQVQDVMRVHAAREFLGFELPEIHARNISRYIAARAEARRRLEKMDPSPEEVLPFFDLRLRHLHAGLPAYDETKPSIGWAKDEDGKTKYDDYGGKIPVYPPLRNKPVPDKPYKLPEHLGRRGVEAATTEEERARRTQPSKLEWAEMYHKFLNGQKGISVFEDQVVAPGAGIGYGYSVEDRLAVQHDLLQAANAISAMGSATVRKKVYSRSKTATYKVKDLGDIALRRLGIDQEEHSVKALSRTVPVYRKTGRRWEPVEDSRVVESVMQDFVAQAMEALPKHTKAASATRLAERSRDILAPKASVPLGPTFAEVLKDEASKLKSIDVERFRGFYETKLRRAGEEGAARRVSRMNDDELRLEMAKQSKRAKRLSAEMHRAMTQIMTVERVDPLYGIASMQDPETGEWESAKVRMNYDRWFKKALTDLTSAIIRDLLYFPNTMRLLLSDVPPTLARAAFEKAIGL